MLTALSLAPWNGGAQRLPTDSRDSGTIRVSLEAGALAATPFAEDGNGVTVRARPGIFVGGTLGTPLAPRVGLVGGVRASVSALRLESAAAGEWRGGTTSQVDFRLGVDTRITRTFRVIVAAAVARAAGPRHVVPFRAGEGSLWMPGAEVAGLLSLPTHRKTAVVAAASAFRIGSRSRAEPPLAGGWVGQLRLGVRSDLR